MAIVKDFLLKLGVDTETINTLMAEEAPEDFNIDDQISEFKKGMFSVFEAENKKKWTDEAVKGVNENVYLKAINSVNSKLVKGLGIEISEEMNTDKIVSVIKEEIDKAHNVKKDEYANKYRDAQNQNVELQSQLKENQQKIQELVESRAQFEKDWVARKEADDYITKALHSVDWDTQDKEVIEWRIQNFKRELGDSYKWDGSGKVTDLDGVAVPRPGKAGVYEDIKTIVQDKAAQLKLVKVSNGQGSGKPQVIELSPDIKTKQKEGIDYSRVEQARRELFNENRS